MKSSVIVWDLETVPDLGRFAAAKDLIGKSDVGIWPHVGERTEKELISAFCDKIAELSPQLTLA